MKIPTCTQTPGLDRYPEGERFAVYRATHKRSMREDAAYRRRFSSYVTALICLVIIPIVGWAISAYLIFRQQEFRTRGLEMFYNLWPNKSQEPTAVGACCSAVAVHAASRRWFSFFR